MYVCVCVCVCALSHLVCGFVEQASVEEALLLVALTPLQMSHSFLPSLLWEHERGREKQRVRGLKYTSELSLCRNCICFIDLYKCTKLCYDPGCTWWSVQPMDCWFFLEILFMLPDTFQEQGDSADHNVQASHQYSLLEKGYLFFSCCHHILTWGKVKGQHVWFMNITEAVSWPSHLQKNAVRPLCPAWHFCPDIELMSYCNCK